MEVANGRWAALVEWDWKRQEAVLAAKGASTLILHLISLWWWWWKHRLANKLGVWPETKKIRGCSWNKNKASLIEVKLLYKKYKHGKLNQPQYHSIVINEWNKNSQKHNAEHNTGLVDDRRCSERKETHLQPLIFNWVAGGGTNLFLLLLLPFLHHFLSPHHFFLVSALYFTVINVQKLKLFLFIWGCCVHIVKRKWKKKYLWLSFGFLKLTRCIRGMEEWLTM